MARTYRYSESVRAAVRRRADGKCERCGRPFTRLYGPKGSPRSDATMHHRQKREFNGQDSVTNLLLLHIDCHRLIHDDEEWADSLGLIMDVDRSAWTPVILHVNGKTGWYILTPDGGYTHIDGDMARKLFEQACLVPRQRQWYRRQRHRSLAGT